MMKEDNPLTKLYYAISEVADMLLIAPSVIRYWETEFTQIHPAKNSKGERKFTAKDIEIFATDSLSRQRQGIYHRRRKERIGCSKQEKKEDQQLLVKLRELRKKITQFKEQLS
ncbi:MAG: MerR family transcriptional regulator [Saprospiraceae bacterium]|nr:MerR family transcriptional regulator [Saprospiraceae bacterium]